MYWDITINPIRDEADQVISILFAGRDITERVQAEEALRESEELFRLLLDSTGEAIYGLDLEGNCTFCNPACLKLLGYGEVSDLLGKNMHDVLHHTRPDGSHYPEEECRIYQAFRQGEGTHVDDEVLWRADGTSFPAEYRSFPIRRDGELIGSVVTFVDITERVEAEKSLRVAHKEVEKAGEYLETLIEDSPDAIISTDKEGKVVLFNEGAEVLLGYRREEVFGQRVTLLYESEERAKEVMRQMRERGGRVAGFETILRAKGGSIIPVLISASILYDEEGEEAGTVGFNKDLRERKRAEEAIRSLKEFNENVVQSIQDGLVSIDRDFRITFWNRAMEKLQGYKAEEVLGKVATEIFPFLIDQGVDEFYRAALEGQVVELTGIFYQTPEGKPVYTNAQFLPLKDQTGKVIGVLAIVEDVTETVRLEEHVTRLQEEIKGRKLVEIAKGVLMQEMDFSEPESYQYIQKKSQDERMKMTEVAKLVIESFGSPKERKKILDIIHR